MSLSLNQIAVSALLASLLATELQAEIPNLNDDDHTTPSRGNPISNTRILVNQNTQYNIIHNQVVNFYPDRTDSERFPGTYIIKNRSLPTRSLSKTGENSQSGDYVDVSEENNAKWHIKEDRETGSFTIENQDGNLLSWTFNKSASGHYVQILKDGCYYNESSKYSRGGVYRNSVLWDISEAEISGFYTISSHDPDLSRGLLSWTRATTPHGGNYAQVLDGNLYNTHQAYLQGGYHRDSVLWELELIRQ